MDLRNIWEEEVLVEEVDLVVVATKEEVTSRIY